MLNIGRNMKNLILFDMDGTLTKPRKCIAKSMHKMLRYLATECKAEIGIVTGSGMNYIQDQLWPILNDVVLRTSVHLLPCNGTEFWPAPAKPHLMHEMFSKANMKDEVGEHTFKALMKILCQLQAEMVKEYEFPLTGHFISNRESTINWCPIGRNADNVDREWFVGLDDKNGIRAKFYQKLLQELRSDTSLDGYIQAKIGGSTSFDIFPTGWDKTYCLNHFDEDMYNLWFIGDKCEEGGNDKELYDFLLSSETHFAAQTIGPEHTMSLLTEFIIPYL